MEDKIPPSPTSVFARVHDTEIFLLQRLQGPPQNRKHNSYVKKSVSDLLYHHPNY